MVILNREDGDYHWFLVGVYRENESPFFSEPYRFLVFSFTAKTFVIEASKIYQIKLSLYTSKKRKLSAYTFYYVYWKPCNGFIQK